MFTTCVKEIIYDHDNKQIKVGALLNEVVKHTMPKIDTWEDKIYHHCLMDLDCIYLSSLMLKKNKNVCVSCNLFVLHYPYKFMVWF